MAAKNEITGDSLVSKKNNDNYRNNYDAIFGKQEEEKKMIGFGKAVLKQEGAPIDYSDRGEIKAEPYETTWYERKIPLSCELAISRLIDKFFEENGYPEMVSNWDGSHT